MSRGDGVSTVVLAAVFRCTTLELLLCGICCVCSPAGVLLWSFNRFFLSAEYVSIQLHTNPSTIIDGDRTVWLEHFRVVWFDGNIINMNSNTTRANRGITAKSLAHSKRRTEWLMKTRNRAHE